MNYDHTTDYLSLISGLDVYFSYDSNNNKYYVFRNGGITYKTTYTYRKAILFAQGVDLGRKLKK